MMSLALVHLLPEALRAHVSPYFFDVGQALLLRAFLPRKRPAGRRLSIREPDRILFLVVHDNLVLGVRITRHRGAPVDLQPLQAAHVAAVANASGVPACRASRSAAAATRNRQHGTNRYTSVRN